MSEIIPQHTDTVLRTDCERFSVVVIEGCFQEVRVVGGGTGHSYLARCPLGLMLCINYTPQNTKTTRKTKLPLHAPGIGTFPTLDTLVANVGVR